MSFMTPTEYLELFKISEDKYIIGIFQDGISIVKQQIRALNIFNYLVEVGKIKNHINYRICVIGGGVAGITFATAAVRAGNSVEVIESNSDTLHFQKECCTRHLHPNIYEWPDKGSLYPIAKIPILDWRKDLASNVVGNLHRQIEDIQDEIKYETKPRFKIHLDTDVKSIKSIRGEHWVSYHSTNKDATLNFDLIIYAVGYGVERGENPFTKSYWRNDSFSQTNLNNDDLKFLVSGVGDGGLIDVFRLKIKEFSYENFIKYMKINPDKYNELIAQLRNIKFDIKGKEISDDYLYYSFSKMPETCYDYIIDRILLDNKIRKTTVVLNGEKNFKNILDLKSISLINAFIVFLLKKNKIISYEIGKLEKLGEKYILNDVEYDKDWEVITRHGTKREDIISSLVSIGEKKSKLLELKKKQRETLNYGSVIPQWNYSDLYKLIYKTHYKKRIEYIDPHINEFFSEKLRPLFSNLIDIKKKDDQFRLNLYKIKIIDNEQFVQQVTPYFESKSDKTSEVKYESVGQVFKIDRGSVGFSMRTNLATLIVRNDVDEFEKIVSDLNLDSGFAQYNQSQSFFTYPIMSQIDRKPISTFIIFVESESLDFFTPEVITTIRDYSVQFVEDLNVTIVSNYDILPNEEYLSLSFPTENRSDINVMTNKCWSSIPVKLHISKRVLETFNTWEAI